jgi:hypothetical protein
MCKQTFVTVGLSTFVTRGLTWSMMRDEIVLKRLRKQTFVPIGLGCITAGGLS